MGRAAAVEGRTAVHCLPVVGEGTSQHGRSVGR